MNAPSDEVLLASARRALADAAPAEPSPALLAAVRREAARRARLVGFRRAFFLAAAAAAAILLALAWPVLNAGIDRSPRAAVASADNPADAAVRLLLLDAAETRAALASASTDSAAEESDGAGSAADTEIESDWSTLSFSEALLAWQEAPLADLAVF